MMICWKTPGIRSSCWAFRWHRPSPLIDPEVLEDPDLVCARQLPYLNGQEVEVVAYYVTRKVTYTIKGEVMFFGTFIDRNGEWVDTVHFPDVAKQYRFRARPVTVSEAR